MSGPGKGDKWRKNFDYKKFWTNFDLISSTPVDNPTSKYPKYKKIKKLKNSKTRYIYN